MLLGASPLFLRLYFLQRPLSLVDEIGKHLSGNVHGKSVQFLEVEVLAEFLVLDEIENVFVLVAVVLHADSEVVVDIHSLDVVDLGHFGVEDSLRRLALLGETDEGLDFVDGLFRVENPETEIFSLPLREANWREQRFGRLQVTFLPLLVEKKQVLVVLFVLDERHSLGAAGLILAKKRVKLLRYFLLVSYAQYLFSLSFRHIK